jgi:cytochrome c-type biogenesis protein CcmE
MMLIVAAVVTFSVAVILVLFAFQKNLVFFFTPSQVMAHEAPQGRPFRVGGMVTTGSLKRLADGVSVQFSVTDTSQTMNEVYKGVLPDFFK